MVALLPIAPLFVPGDRPERFNKAESQADVVILDLEDGVSHANKLQARNWVVGHKLINASIWVRVNAYGTPWFEEDIAALKNTELSAFLLSKTETPDQVLAVRELFGRPVPIIPLIETAVGLGSLSSILRAEGVIGTAFGSLDFALDLGCAHDWNTLRSARSEIVLQSRIANLPRPLDGVCTSIQNLELVRRDSLLAAKMGFGGKLSIHPLQISPIVASFTPDEQEILRAERIVSSTVGGAATQLEGTMIDRPVLERAKLLLARTRASPRR